MAGLPCDSSCVCLEVGCTGVVVLVVPLGKEFSCCKISWGRFFHWFKGDPCSVMAGDPTLNCIGICDCTPDLCGLTELMLELGLTTTGSSVRRPGICANSKCILFKAFDSLSKYLEPIFNTQV